MTVICKTKDDLEKVNAAIIFTLKTKGYQMNIRQQAQKA